MMNYNWTLIDVRTVPERTTFNPENHGERQFFAAKRSRLSFNSKIAELHELVFLWSGEVGAFTGESTDFVFRFV